MPKKKIEIPLEQLKQYDLVVSMVPGMERKGVTMPYTSMNGNMYTIMRNDGVLGLRLSKEEGIKFLETFDTVMFENYGSKMKDYVTVPDALLMNTEKMVEYLIKSHENAKTLKPKPTKK